MSIKIHHGPNGSYKSSGAIADDLIPAFVSGRTIITNVRGLDSDSVCKALELPLGHGEIIHIDTEGRDGLEGRERLARVFHWAPRGAFIFVDEVQEIWKPRWREADIAKLSWPSGPEDADNQDRPRDFHHFCSMHRHWNWDLVVTTQDISWVRDEIRGVADGAYRHMNGAFVGFKGRYAEIQHHPMNAGTALSHVVNKRFRKVPAYVFRCYQSTATGVASDTVAGTALWKNPRVLILLAFLGGVGAWVFSRPLPSIIGGSSQKGLQPVPPTSGPARQVSDIRSSEAGAVVARGGDAGSRVKGPSLDDPFKDGHIVIEGTIRQGDRFSMALAYYADGFKPMRWTQGPGSSLLGMAVTVYGDCLARVDYVGGSKWARCGRPDYDERGVESDVGADHTPLIVH